MTQPRKTFQDYGIDVPTGRDGEIDTTCPKCSHTRRNKSAKCLSVNLGTGAFKCWHCEGTGHIDSGWSGESDNERLHQVKYLPPKPLVLPKQDSDIEKALAHLEQTRGMDRGFLADHGVAVCESWCVQCEQKRVAIAFTYFKNGEHVHTKYRDGKKHFWTDSRTQRVLYGYDAVVNPSPEITSQPVVFCEGEIDRLSLMFAGFPRAVSVPDGAPNPDAKNLTAKFTFLDDSKLMAALIAAPGIIIAVDADEPGEALEKELGRRLGYERCTRVTWPEGIKDANEALVRIGIEGLRQIIELAEPFPVEGLVTFADVSLEIERLYETGLPKGYSTGWDSVDELVRLMPGMFVVLHGNTGSGKSTFMNAVMLNLIDRYGMPVGVCSPEWQPIAMHAIAFMETHTGKPFDKRHKTAMTSEEMRESKRWLNDYVTFIMPKDRSIPTVLERIKAAVFRRGLKFVVLDPWVEFHHNYGNDKLAYIEQTLATVRATGHELGVIMVLVVHPPKPPRTAGNVKVGRAGLYGPAGSADFANKADVEIEVIRNIGSNLVTVHVDKVRSRHAGRPGSAELYFDERTGRYTMAQISASFVIDPPGYVDRVETSDVIQTMLVDFDGTDVL